MDPITVLVVDDEPLLAQAYEMILGSDPGITVVGAARDGMEGVEAYQRLRPDVVIMDLRMPVLDGVQATRQIIEFDPQARILVATSMSTEEYLTPALAAGASGYLAKDTDGQRLQRAVHDVAAGTVALGPSVARDLVKLAVQHAEAESSMHPSGSSRTPRSDDRANDQPLRDPLTPREQSVLDLLAEGLTNQEMAQRLFLSDSTVKSNLARVMHKLGANNRVQALLLGVRHGLVELPH
ncbi:MAG: response regulator transcription factor [Micrococcus sp.]|nr:response regulator transcription factor [Micrococcus sp.]